ncbi:MAG: hypothetical protein GX579_06465 [Chloroflexi bacterium]|nr:hypothetical protein [Chloroflexota bacterium]
MSESRIPARDRALGLWARCWQLAGGQWPPPSRAITRQCIVMLRNLLLDASEGRLTDEEALERAWETMAPLTAQRFYPGGEQDVAIERLTKAILDAEIGPLP